jgi:hypothetical protein
MRIVDAQAGLAARVVAKGETHVAIVPPAGFDRLKAHWRGLADKAVTPNPFMAPEFLEPAAVHLAQRHELALAAVFRRHARSQELIGLFALTQNQRRAFGFGRAADPSLWSHPEFPDATPLLGSDAGDAEAAAEALFDAVGAGRRGGLTMPFLAADSAALAVLRSVAERKGLAVQLSRHDPHSHGLHLMLREPRAAAAVMVARDPTPLMAMLEQALAMDAQRPRLPGQPTAELGDQRLLSFTRAAVRGFSHTGAAVMARFEQDGRRAAALAWLSGGNAHVWRLFGPDASHPTAEAALAHAIGAASGARPIAATREPVSGLCMAAKPTVTMRLSPMA